MSVHLLPSPQPSTGAMTVKALTYPQLLPQCLTKSVSGNKPQSCKMCAIIGEKQSVKSWVDLFGKQRPEPNSETGTGCLWDKRFASLALMGLDLQYFKEKNLVPAAVSV